MIKAGALIVAAIEAFDKGYFKDEWEKRINN